MRRLQSHQGSLVVLVEVSNNVLVGSPAIDLRLDTKQPPQPIQPAQSLSSSINLRSKDESLSAFWGGGRKLLVTSATLVVTSALLVVTRSFNWNSSYCRFLIANIVTTSKALVPSSFLFPPVNPSDFTPDPKATGEPHPARRSPRSRSDRLVLCQDPPGPARAKLEIGHGLPVGRLVEKWPKLWIT